jgi:aminoglycoside 3-N-acetyltransferase
MPNQVLFESSEGSVTTSTFREALLSTSAHEADVLYVHSGLNFGQPPKGLSRSSLLSIITEIILGLGVKTVCMPTFTFSFCNGESYDIQNSRSHMGTLNEYFRKRPDVYRSADPLMSVAAYGEDQDLVQNLGIQSTGRDSNFDKLNARQNVKFLFLGVHPGDCFTYMHYLEWKAGVPYRYDRRFTGEVINNGASTSMTKDLFVRFKGVVPNEASYTYGDMLLERGDLLRINVGNSSISASSLEPARELYLNLLSENPNHFITEPFETSKVTDDFVVNNMVAL